MDILSLIRNALHERYDVAAETVMPETKLETLGIDSLGLVELMFEVEDRLGIRMPQDFPTPATVADLVDIVSKVLNAHQGQPA